MKKAALLLVVLILATGCTSREGTEIVSFDNTDIHILGGWEVDLEGVVGSVKGVVYNGGLYTYEGLEITATVYDGKGAVVLSSSTNILRLAPNTTYNLRILRLIDKDSPRQWERVAWDLQFSNRRIGFVEEVLLNMPETQREAWANIIYSTTGFYVRQWPTLFDADIQLANYAVETGREQEYDRSWFIRHTMVGQNWNQLMRALIVWHITSLPEPFRTQEIERTKKLSFPTSTTRQRTFFNLWETYVYTSAGYIQLSPSYEWVYNPTSAARIYPQVTADLRAHCMEIIQQ